MFTQRIEQQLKNYAFESVTGVQDLKQFSSYPFSYELLQRLGEVIRQKGLEGLQHTATENLLQRQIEVWTFQNQDQNLRAAIFYHDDDFGLELLLYDVIHLE